MSKSLYYNDYDSNHDSFDKFDDMFDEYHGDDTVRHFDIHVVYPPDRLDDVAGLFGVDEDQHKGALINNVKNVSITRSTKVLPDGYYDTVVSGEACRDNIENGMLNMSQNAYGVLAEAYIERDDSNFDHFAVENGVVLDDDIAEKKEILEGPYINTCDGVCHCISDLKKYMMNEVVQGHRMYVLSSFDYDSRENNAVVISKPFDTMVTHVTNNGVSYSYERGAAIAVDKNIITILSEREMAEKNVNKRLSNDIAYNALKKHLNVSDTNTSRKLPDVSYADESVAPEFDFGDE